MKKLYEKSELWFALAWIIAYVVLFSAGDAVSSAIGIEKAVTVGIALVLTAVLLLWLKKEKLFSLYGLNRVEGQWKRYAFFLPLLLLVGVNFLGGVQRYKSAWETVFYLVSMLCVGILEELLFRGLLFVCLKKINVKVAVLVGSLTFGAGHVMNLLTGAPIFSTLLQIVYATAAGFLFTVLLLKTKSLLPCIVTHCAVNMTSAFAVEGGKGLEWLSALFLTVVSLVYALWLLRHDLGKKTNERTELSKQEERI